MKNVLKKGIIILGVYIIFTLYLFVASERIERLENNSKIGNEEVTLNISK